MNRNIKILVIISVLMFASYFTAISCTVYALENIEGAYEVNPVMASRFASFSMFEAVYPCLIVLVVHCVLPVVGYVCVHWIAVRCNVSVLGKVAFCVAFGYLGFYLILFGVDAVNDVVFVCSNL